MRVLYACTAGHMEAAAIDAFLRKLDPRLGEKESWVRIFPARRLPGPRPVRSDLRPPAGPAPEPPDMHPNSGMTGAALLRAIEQILAFHRREPAQEDLVALVLLDDADCRFCPGSPLREPGETLEAAVQRFRNTLTESVQASLGRPLPVIVLLAAPEGEAWLYADWAEGFGKEYPAVQHALRQSIDRDLLGGTPVEQWGGWDPAKVSCTEKFSDRIISLFDAAPEAGGIFRQDTNGRWTPADPDRLAPGEKRYSKAVNGARMLHRIRPERVAELCTVIFRAGHRALKRLCDDHAARREDVPTGPTEAAAPRAVQPPSRSRRSPTRTR